MKRDPIRPMEVAWLESEAEEHARRKLTHERCLLMEAALRAVGFAPRTLYWQVGLLIAKLCHAWQPLERDLDKLAADREFDSDGRSIRNRKVSLRRCLNELQAMGVIEWSTRANEATRRRCRPTSIACISIDRQTLEAIAVGLDTTRDTTAQQREIQRRNDEGYNGATTGDTTAQQSDELSLYVSLSPNTHIPSSPSQCELTTTAREFDFVSDKELDQALESAGVECKRLVCREAQAHRVTRSELLDACFVVRHTAKLTGGSLVAWIRNGGWPVSGVPTAEQIRDRRHAAAERIRSNAMLDAKAAEVARGIQIPEEFTRKVIADRLRDAGLEDQVQGLVGFERV